MLRQYVTRRGRKPHDFSPDDLAQIATLLGQDKTNAEICALIQGGIPERTFQYRLRKAGKTIEETRKRRLVDLAPTGEGTVTA